MLTVWEWLAGVLHGVIATSVLDVCEAKWEEAGFFLSLYSIWQETTRGEMYGNVSQIFI